MIDWHSHVLPQLDDGSRSLEESVAMLEALKSQGVDTVIATPHFYANEESVEAFLERRKKSHDLLSSEMKSDDVRVVCGAEVKYYPGISRMEELNKLSVENTNLLLLEMPFAKWTDYTIGELAEISNMRGLKIALAHVERYNALRDKRLAGKLVENGILFQSNASFFIRFGTKLKAIKLLGSGWIHFVGSDCHNMTSRPPKLDLAYKAIKKKLGEEFLTQMSEYGYQALKSKTKKT